MDYDLPSVYRDENLIARKERKCCECQRIIKPKDQYNRFTGCWDGKWATYNTCADCYELRHEMSTNDEAPAFGELRDWAAEAGIDFPVVHVVNG